MTNADHSIFIKFDKRYWIIVARYFCALIVHLAIVVELRKALDMMKYALNHPYEFQSWAMAYYCGLLKALALISVETQFVLISCVTID